MTYIEDDTSFYEADLVLDWSQFFDHTFSLHDEDFEVQFIHPGMPAYNVEELSIQSLQCCDNDLDCHTSGHSGWDWNDAVTEDFHARLQGSHAPIVFDALADHWPGDVLLANAISQQELKATTPYSPSSTSPSSIDIPGVK
ncbi:hypothetical protein CBER1_02351 [Cercospora berteroae]|uniref:Uncharacterized protein n=1 Tax=Cercospora berteroae TaxID=357750 RepID=A0A2S6CLY6_9PEZI|nr:hypothetical protein CBER1_02351 [Cercospora berteroae]